MKTLLLDTNIVSYLFKGSGYFQAYAAQLKGQRLAISLMTVGELYQSAAVHSKKIQPATRYSQS